MFIEVSFPKGKELYPYPTDTIQPLKNLTNITAIRNTTVNNADGKNLNHCFFQKKKTVTA
jgi:hypothetical protein